MNHRYEKCVVCNRIIENSPRMPFCSLHMKAYDNLIAGYVDWRKAYGDLSPKEFLEKLKDNEYSGSWVREITRVILSRDDLMQIFLDDLSCRGMRD